MMRIYLKSGAVIETNDKLKARSTADRTGELVDLQWTWPGLDAGALVTLRYLDLSQVSAIVAVYDDEREAT